MNTTTTATDPRAMIRQAVEAIRVEPDQVIELRAVRVPMRYGRPAVIAGWFDDMDRLTAAAVSLERRGAPGIYTTINVVNPGLLARACNRLIEHPQATTADHDIARRVWLPIDIDPVRPAGISATAEEIDIAKHRTAEVEDWLRGELGDDPTIRGFSGNGWHLLFRIDLPNDQAAARFVKGVIDAAADRFDDDRVTVDRTVFNPARIWKLYGTLARKGDQVPALGRVHRRAAICTEAFDRDPDGTTQTVQ